MERDHVKRQAAARAAAGIRRAVKLEAAMTAIAADVEHTRVKLAELHEAHARADADPRSRLFHELMAKSGARLPRVLEEVERQFPTTTTGEDDGK